MGRFGSNSNSQLCALGQVISLPEPQLPHLLKIDDGDDNDSDGDGDNKRTYLTGFENKMS